MEDFEIEKELNRNNIDKKEIEKELEKSKNEYIKEILGNEGNEMKYFLNKKEKTEKKKIPLRLKAKRVLDKLKIVIIGK